MRKLFYFGLILFLSACSAEKDPFDYVDPFIGTGGHGHTFPGATLPFGMVQLSPDTRLTGWDGCSGYHYSDTIVYGFSHTHLSGTGVSDYGDILLMPFTGDVNFNNGADGSPGYRSRFSKREEIAMPGYYKTHLPDNDIEVELSTSSRVGFHRYHFRKEKDRKLIIDLEHRDEVTDAGIFKVNDTELAGYRHSRAWAQDQRIFFRISFDTPIQGIDYDSEDSLKVAIDFGEGDELKVKVGISAVDEEGALKNLEKEIPHWDFERLRSEAAEIWNQQLNKIRVEGGSERQKKIFYTALYHTMIAPNLYQDVDGRFRGTDLKIHSDTSYKNYTVFSLWDTYRSTHPLYTIIERKRSLDFIKTFLNHYEFGGILPMWELAANYTGCMIGYHAVPVIADAYTKGIRDFDTGLALEAMLYSAMQERLGIGEFRKLGYIPSDKEAESVSKTLEYAYDDWCIAFMAEELGRPEIAGEFYQRAQNYKNVFDPETGFMRARSNNRWFYPFDPAEVNFNYTEANSWQYSFYVPQDIENWIKLLGGEENAEKMLDALFAADSKTTGRDQADITGLIGQYAHGNEPSHHIPYLYNFVGRPDKTQKLVRQIMAEMYSDQPDGLSGNEDCGQMSSWLVMSALGFYPVTPGTSDYILGSPWFDRAVISLENGKEFVIEANNNNENNIYVSSISLNGEGYSSSYLKHDDIMKGGNLQFNMSRSSSEFGRKPENRPNTSISKKIPAIPALTSGDHAFMDSTLISINCADSDAQIFYSFSTKDEGIVYKAPFYIKTSTDIYTWSVVEEKLSRKAKSSFYRIPEKRKIELENAYAPHYNAGGDIALIDFIRGNDDFRTGAWQGYYGTDLVATVDLGEVRKIDSVKIGFLQDENSWIFMPLNVNFSISLDGKDFTEMGSVENDVSFQEKGSIIRDFQIGKSSEARYVKVEAKNRQMCPPGHKGEGNKAWIFADEIVIK